MTTGRFESLIYTDCRPGQGLLGTAGLQFQARTTGADQKAMRLVQRNLLYEPPAGWMRDRRPPQEYPLSFAHIGNGQYATAAGVYLGREVNGGREGNQLTHGIVAADADAYEFLRPAQLFQASFWRTEPAPTTRCPPLPRDWHPGPIDAYQAQRFVLAQPSGPELLTALLSAVQRAGPPDARRVLFISRDPTHVVSWLAAATLLIPQPKALDLGFKVFTTNPAYAQQHVLAVHPDWESTPASVDNDLGYYVFDLEVGRWSRVEPTATAPQWTRLFLAEDPYDISDAVEVAAASGLDEERAPGVALTAVLGRRPEPPDVGPVLDWLRAGAEPVVTAYGERVVDVLLERPTEWPPATLVKLDNIVQSRVVEERSTQVRQAVIAALAEHALRTGDAVVARPVKRTALRWSDADEAEARTCILSALAGAPPDRMDALLRVADRYGIPITVAHLGQSAHEFVRFWADRPDAGYSHGEWPCGDELESLLRAELNRRIIAYPASARRIGDQWWSVMLRHETRLGTPLDEAVLASAAARNAPGQRDLIKRCLLRAAESPDGSVTVGRIAGALFRYCSPDAESVLLLCEIGGSGSDVDPRLFDQYIATAIDPNTRLTDLDLWACGAIVQSFRGYGGPRLDGLLAQDRLLATVLTRLPSFSGAAAELSNQLAPVSPRVLDARAAAVVDSLLLAASPHGVQGVLAVNPRLTRPCAGALIQVLGTGGTPANAATAFVLASDHTLDSRFPELRSQLEEVVKAWMGRARRSALRRARNQIRRVGPSSLSRWDYLAKRYKKPGLIQKYILDGLSR